MEYIKNRILSFKYAFWGIDTLFRETPNAVIQLVAAIAAILSGLFFHITNAEWLILILSIGGVLTMETINSALENLSDYASKKEMHPTIRKVKDLSAAAVLIMAIAALAIGLVIFLPRIIHLFS
ncbi:MAG: diacylglycerol kinase family protein [Proteiniphilum sp.]|jgi:diacylglycerol kinase|nr:diacylglycerol kinase family protein [Proteiniphilum sp.]NCD14698.1 diacylglycerol kinase family protein [Bacteroidia bacterium]MDD2726492.1 diacylglycerol kinase family protein [Proteiniphilum sp.]MDD3333364.1 diacylglycerol kinase family protein [Proteiniphilum sp.]MDD3555750.1 diacylglycerol kinase family protein [Proteiniphilum sp.]